MKRDYVLRDAGTAGTGKLLEHLTMPSGILEKEVQYSLYLPYDYENSRRYYPVVYLLHGSGDDDSAWIQFGEVHHAADRGIVLSEIPPMIIVMPDGRRDDEDTHRTFYINDADGIFRWEDMFIREFLPFIESEYRVRTDREFRGIAGLSMGGYGALLHSMQYPEIFSTCVAFSAAVWTDEQMIAMPQDDYECRYGRGIGKELEGEERLIERYRQYSILDLVKNLPVSELSRVRYFLDCGAEDDLIEGNSLLHLIMRRRNIPHDYQVRKGEHTWNYWRTGITNGLKFLGETFRR